MLFRRLSIEYTLWSYDNLDAERLRVRTRKGSRGFAVQNVFP
jgi:hypothetical protein